jgi:alkylhydroperoxidase family enzyme
VIADALRSTGRCPANIDTHFAVRVSEKPLRRYPWYLRPFFWNQKRKYGQVLTPGLLWGRVPKLFMAVATLYGVLDRRSSPLDRVLRSLVTVRVSQMNWCRFR